jgi:hypothetical protein
VNRTPRPIIPTSPQPWLLPQPAWSCCPAVSELEALAAGFTPILLDQMDAVALLDRTDTKFLMTSAQLLQALAHLQADYSLLAVNERRLIHYRSLYYDTPDFELYRAQVNGNAERCKVRSREYTDSQLSFLEVKQRTRKNRTVKARLLTSHPAARLDSELENWLENISSLDASALEIKLCTTFTRITLVSTCRCERVTLDTELAFYTGDRWVRLDGIAVAELKTNAARADSPFIAEIRAQRIRQQGFSKYAVGVALLYDQVKKNALKPRLLWLGKIMKGLDAR